MQTAEPRKIQEIELEHFANLPELKAFLGPLDDVLGIKCRYHLPGAGVGVQKNISWVKGISITRGQILDPYTLNSPETDKDLDVICQA